MILPDFSVRDPGPELMDDPAVPDAELLETLDELSLVNRLLGGHATSLGALERLLPPGRRSFTLLDVGTGGGDTPRAIAAWARARGLEARILAIDLSAASIGRARELSRDFPEIEFRAADLFSLPEDRPFDIVHSSLVLHHFPGDSAAQALKRQWALCRLGLAVNDLHRHPVAYHAIGVLTRALSNNRLILNDAPLSVLRAFRRSCLVELCRAAGLPAPEIRWRWAFRWELVARR